jgi:hypothetical protein
MSKVLRWSAILIAVVGALANLPAMVVGSSLLGGWIHIHTSDGPYFQYSYLAVATVCVMCSALGLSGAGLAIWRRSFYVLPSIVAIVVGLASMEVLPEVGPRLNMMEETTGLLGHADQSLSAWDETHNRFPSDERELREALAIRPLREPIIFFQRGKPIPYDVRFVPNSTGPALEPLPVFPGTLVYAISSDYKEYWLTVTSLRDPARGPVATARVFGDYDRGNIRVMNRKHHIPGEGWQPFIE